jgi:hypothetical protein
MTFRSPVFETGALPVRRTLRFSRSRMMNPNRYSSLPRFAPSREPDHPEPRRCQWIPEGLEPSFPGCKPGVLPLDDGPFTAAGRARTFSLGLRRAALFPLSYRSRGTRPDAPKGSLSRPRFHSDPGRIRTCNTPDLSRRPLPSWATGPLYCNSIEHNHLRSEHTGKDSNLQPPVS